MRTLANKLMAMAMAVKEGLAEYPKCRTKTNNAGYPQFNSLNTRNSYGGFTWAIRRRKGHPIAIINLGGKLYCRLQMSPGFDHQAMQQEIMDFLNDRLCCEVDK